MINNAGIHASVNFFRTQWGNDNYYDLLFGNSSRLAGFTAVGDRNMLGWINNVKTLVPGMSVLGRLTPHESIKATWGEGDPVAKARQWAADMNADLAQSSYDAATRFIYWQPLDETKKNYEWHVQFDITAMNAMKDYGRRYAALNLYTGCPEQTPYDPTNEWDILWPMVQEAARLGSQWVTLQTHCYIDTSKALTFEEQKYHALRPFYLLNRARQEGLKIELRIGETGTLAGFPYSGVRDFAAYADILKWLWDQYQPYPEVKCINTYTCDTLSPDGDNLWIVPPEVVHAIRDYNIANYSTTPTPTPEPTPEPEPGGVVETVTRSDGYNSNIRATPDTSSSANIITTLAQGAKIGIGPLSNGWYPVWFSDCLVGVIRSDRVVV
jgi:hypothetical protein